MAKEKKRHRKDRRDAYYVSDADSMHLLMPYIMPNRTDNEALATLKVDLEGINSYIAERNAESPEHRYTMFHVITAALAKTMVLRPYMNRFISGHRMYERKEISFAFVAKREFKDDSYEALIKIIVDPDDERNPMEQIHEKICAKVYPVKHKSSNVGISDAMDVVGKLPRFLVRFVVWVLKKLEYHGHYPKFLEKDDPDYSSVFISNLGSIKMSANYHHLANWGTNSFFAVIGEKHKEALYDEGSGSVQVKDVLDIALTIDERIADGVYFAKSINIFKELLSNPRLLEESIHTPVEIQ